MRVGVEPESRRGKLGGISRKQEEESMRWDTSWY